MLRMEILLTEEQIGQKVDELANAISAAYGERSLHVVALLDNGFMFAADLVRRLTCPVLCSFVRVEMRDVVQDGHERRLIEYSPRLNVAGQDVLVVDSVLQTGVTQDHLIQQFYANGASSVRTAVLVDRADERRTALEPDFAGFRLEGRFLVGYGMGQGNRFRHLPHVAAMTPERSSQAV